MKWEEAKRIINSNPKVIEKLKNNELEYRQIGESLILFFLIIIKFTKPSLVNF